MTTDINDEWKTQVRDWWYSIQDLLADKDVCLHERKRVEIENIIKQAVAKVLEKEIETILGNILKWSNTVTVTETTGRGGPEKATKKLREHLYGSYHFLYQALRINQPETDLPTKTPRAE